MKEKICSKCGRKGPLWRSKPALCKWCKGSGIQLGQKSPHFKSNKCLTPSKTKEFNLAKPRQKPIRKQTPESIAWGKQRVAYYKEAISDNKDRNEGIVRCDECNAPVPQIKGRPGLNVRHVVGGGANKLLYLDKRNNFILGNGPYFKQCSCGIKFDDQGEKSEMKIYPRYVEIRRVLTLEYYTS